MKSSILNQDYSQNRKKVLAVASFGGHFVQLQRIMEQFRSKYDIVYVTTSDQAFPAQSDIKGYVVDDFSRTNSSRLLKSVRSFRKIFKEERPDVVITTGAAPGLAAVIMARLAGVRSLWIDSMANTDNLSLCGRIAKHIATTTLTQWPNLVEKNVKHYGSVI